MLEYAQRLLKWNKQHLTFTSELTVENIAEVFAKEFVVKANGRLYRANYETYLEFLNDFRRNIRSIKYEVQEYICEANVVAFPLDATIVRINDEEDKFHAMMLLKFDKDNLITWWQEVYI